MLCSHPLDKWQARLEMQSQEADICSYLCTEYYFQETYLPVKAHSSYIFRINSSMTHTQVI